MIKIFIIIFPIKYFWVGVFPSFQTITLKSVKSLGSIPINGVKIPSKLAASIPIWFSKIGFDQFSDVCPTHKNRASHDFYTYKNIQKSQENIDIIPKNCTIVTVTQQYPVYSIHIPMKSLKLLIVGHIA